MTQAPGTQSNKNNLGVFNLNSIYGVSPSNLSKLKVTETRSSYLFKLKISGYVLEDFRFYISGNHLVLTTEKNRAVENSQENLSHSGRHAYCYPSAYFKMNIPLPKEGIKNEITAGYQDDILSFELFKLK